MLYEINLMNVDKLFLQSVVLTFTFYANIKVNCLKGIPNWYARAFWSFTAIIVA